MEVQIFGLKKSAETRKALRFFSERRIRTHFVDLLERELADSELARFIQRFGIDGVLDRGSRRFDELGLGHAKLSDTKWLERLIAEPLILRLPLVRRLGTPAALSVGQATETWKEWTFSAINKPV